MSETVLRFDEDAVKRGHALCVKLDSLDADVPFTLVPGVIRDLLEYVSSLSAEIHALREQVSDLHDAQAQMDEGAVELAVAYTSLRARLQEFTTRPQPVVLPREIRALLKDFPGV